MREIKFRGLSENGWVYGYHTKIKGTCNEYLLERGWDSDPNKYEQRHFDISYIIEMIIPDENGWSVNGQTRFIKVDPGTVGQFTGLHDKNGKEIYEGDVYKCRKYSGTPGKFDRFIGRVYYLSGKFVVRGINKYTGCNAELFQNGEVIGNIHEEQFKHLI